MPGMQRWTLSHHRDPCPHLCLLLVSSLVGIEIRQGQGLWQHLQWPLTLAGTIGPTRTPENRTDILSSPHLPHTLHQAWLLWCHSFAHLSCLPSLPTWSILCLLDNCPPPFNLPASSHVPCPTTAFSTQWPNQRLWSSSLTWKSKPFIAPSLAASVPARISCSRTPASWLFLRLPCSGPLH